MPRLTEAGWVPVPARDAPVLDDALTLHGLEALTLRPDSPLTRLEAMPPALRTIVIRVDAFGDGRVFSLARWLRQQGFGGEIVASGPLVADQYPALRQCGVDAVEIDEAVAKRQGPAQWQGVHGLPHRYQRGLADGGASILDRRRAAGAAQAPAKASPHVPNDAPAVTASPES